MNILESLVRLRDDIKIWTENNLNVLNEKIEKKTAVDNKLSSSSTNPVQNKVITNAINNIPRFSGDYNDLTNAPNIAEDSAGNMIIADESGNIIFKADANGIHTTELTLNGEAAATQTYVNESVSKIDIPDVDFTGYATEEYVANAIADIDIPETDLTDYYTKEETDTAINTAKEELSESIVAESDEWKVVDEAGNIIFGVDASGAHTTSLTLNGENAATESYVDDAIANIEFPTTDLTDYVTKEYVDDAIDGIDIPETDLTGYATETFVTTKIAEAKLEGNDVDLSGYVTKDDIKDFIPSEYITETELDEKGYLTEHQSLDGLATEQYVDDVKTELSESIVSENEEWHVADENGNIIFTVDSNGAHTTELMLNGENIRDIVGNKVETSENNGHIKIDGVDTTVYTHPEKHSISDVDGLQDALAGSGGAKTKTISLLSNSWTGASAPFSQIVTIDGVTANSKVDLHPSIEQLISLQNENVSLVASNNNGIVTVYALNYKPSVDFSMQTLISEVISS